jgi:hypothetical protein
MPIVSITLVTGQEVVQAGGVPIQLSDFSLGHHLQALSCR